VKEYFIAILASSVNVVIAESFLGSLPSAHFLSGM
jgi:hypothetical protein